MNKREFKKLEDELRHKCFPPRPRRLKLHYKRNGQQVLIRRQGMSYFQTKKAEKKFPVYINVPRKRFCVKGSAYTLSMLLRELYEYICDRLF